jgi:hypothetical protein
MLSKPLRPGTRPFDFGELPAGMRSQLCCGEGVQTGPERMLSEGRYIRNRVMRSGQTVHSHRLPRSYKRWRVQWKTNNSAPLSSLHQW